MGTPDVARLKCSYERNLGHSRSWPAWGRAGTMGLGRIESANDDQPGLGEVGTCHPACVVGQGTGGPVFTFALGVSSWGFQLDREEGFAPHGPIHYHRQRLVEYLSPPARGPRVGAQSCVALSFFCRVRPYSLIEFISVTPELMFLPGQLRVSATVPVSRFQLRSPIARVIGCRPSTGWSGKNLFTIADDEL